MAASENVQRALFLDEQAALYREEMNKLDSSSRPASSCRSRSEKISAPAIGSGRRLKNELQQTFLVYRRPGSRRAAKAINKALSERER